MTQIANDHQLRAALNALTPEEQRLMGARFAGNVMHLCRNDRVRRAGQLALDLDADPTERDDALKAAKAHVVKTYMSSPVRLYTFFLNNLGRCFCQSFSACTGERCPNAFCGI